MELMQAVKTVLNNYANFDGRSGRAEFWWWVLAYILGYGVLLIAGNAIGAGRLLAWLFVIGLLIPNIAVSIRRFHDIGKPALWAILMFIPLVNLIIALIFLTKPSDGTNEYGEGPQALAV